MVRGKNNNNMTAMLSFQKKKKYSIYSYLSSGCNISYIMYI